MEKVAYNIEYKHEFNSDIWTMTIIQAGQKHYVVHKQYNSIV